jgi:hypothetical protein
MIYRYIGYIFIIIAILFLPVTINTKIPEKIVDYTDIQDNLQSGDIILFRVTEHKTLISYLCYEARTTLLGCPWGHIGIVYRKPGKRPYLLEFRSKYDVISDNIFSPELECRMIELDIFLERYQMLNGAYYGLRRISRPLDSEHLYKLFKKCMRYSFRPFWKICAILFLPKWMLPGYIYTDGEMFCSEFVAYLLMKMNVLKKSRPYQYFPHHFLEWHDNFLNGYKYNNTILFRL